MGCGCKNNTQTVNTQVSDQKVVESAKKQQTDSIKESIKKTVEKYYYTDKKSNGWVK